MKSASYESESNSVRKRAQFLPWVCRLYLEKYVHQDVLSINNSRVCDFVDRIHPVELEIKDTTDTDRSASYFDLDLEIDSDGLLRTSNIANMWSIRNWSMLMLSV
jgi:hypothetical protein